MTRMDDATLELATVWGYDGEIAGDEDRIQTVMPILKQSSGQFMCLRSLDGEVSLIGDCEAQAIECGTKIVVADPIPYKAGGVLVVMGNRYVERLEMLLEQIPTLDIGLPRFVEIQDGFRVKLMTRAEDERLRFMINEAARTVFDRELIRCRAESVSELGAEALRLLCSTYVDMNCSMQAQLRSMVESKVMGNVSQLERSAAMNVFHFKISQAALMNMVDMLICVARS